MLFAVACSRADTPTTAEPSPQLQPRAVVETVLDALKANDSPSTDAGIATAFAFASPGNRAQTGPLPRFVSMVHNGYGALLNHRAATIGEPAADGDRLVFPVQVIPQSGPVHYYLFVLAQHSGDTCDGCWMTDGVIDQTDQVAPEVTI